MTPGDRVGPYEIVEQLGAGGMGEVWLAQDTRLKRQVAIKVLPAEVASDPERLARLEREAQLLAALEHPNIASVYGLEQDGDTRFLVMQYAEGETLAERLMGGALSIDEALPIGRQIAAGLAAAHDRGIVHRDLKPANVMLGSNDGVKILDFGLAKATREGRVASGTSPDLTASPTAFAATEAGMILGTAAYMSPEQARGREVDRRADLWALGCVLYELLTGTLVFEGDTASDIIAAILRQEPDWGRLPAELPPAASRLLRRCLRKEAEQRHRDAGDAALELDEAIRSLRSSGATAAVVAPGADGTWVRALPWAIAAVAVLALAAVMTGGVSNPPAPDLRVDRLERLVQKNSIIADPSMAPDGSFFAYASNEHGDFEIYSRRTEGTESINITQNPGDDVQPAVSPDGNSVAFVSTRASEHKLSRISDNVSYDYRSYGGDVWLTASLGGQARRLAENGNYPDWHPDGESVAYIGGVELRRDVWRVPVLQGAPELVLAPADSPGEIVRVKHSPDGRWMTLETNDDRLWVMPSGGGAVEELLQASSHSWSADGRSIYYLRPDVLGAVELRVVDFDDGTVRPESDRRFGFLTGVFGDLVTSPAGGQLMALQLEASANLRRIALDPEDGALASTEQALTSGQVLDRLPQYSPDGRYIAYESIFGSIDDIAIFDLETMTHRTLQIPGTRNMTPTWHPDGQRLSVLRQSDDAMEVWEVASDGSDARKLLDLTNSINIDAAKYSPDGRWLAFPDIVDGDQQLFVADPETGERRQLTDGPGDRFDVQWSPDGRWLAYASSAVGGFQVWQLEVATGREVQLTFGPGRILHPSYDPSGEWLYVQPDHRNIYRLPREGGELTQVTFFPESGLYVDEPSVSPDGRWLLYTRSTVNSGLWLITLEKAAQ